MKLLNSHLYTSFCTNKGEINVVQATTILFMCIIGYNYHYCLGLLTHVIGSFDSEQSIDLGMGCP